MTDDLRPECRDVADNATPDLRSQIAALFRHAPGAARLGDQTPGEIAVAVLAVRDEELEQLRAQIPKCNGICLHVSDVLDDMSNVVGNPVARAHRSCPLHGDLEQVAWELDAALAKAEERAEKAEAELEAINQVLRTNGYEYPLGVRGVRDMAHHREVYLDLKREAEAAIARVRRVCEQHAERARHPWDIVLARDVLAALDTKEEPPA